MSAALPGDATAPEKMPMLITLSRRSAVAAKMSARRQGIGLDEFFEKLVQAASEADAEIIRRQMDAEEALYRSEMDKFAEELNMDPREAFPPTEH
jgi:hypothetical protein